MMNTRRLPLLFFGFFFGLLSVESVKASECHHITSPETMMQNEYYAPPYDLFSSGQELLVQTECDGGKVGVTVGKAGSQMLIYKQGYVYRGNKWESYLLTGGFHPQWSEWIVGTGTASVDAAKLDMTGANYLLAFTCQDVDAAWKCGCRDQACAKGFWQLQTFGESSSFGYSTKSNNAGSLASELNVASNGTWSWDNPVATEGVDSYQIELNSRGSTSDGGYFWASSFAWSNKRDSFGYIGLQTRVWPLERARGVIFSIWNTTIAEAAPGGVAKPFDGEGVGMQTANSLDWINDRDYRFSVEKDTARSNSSNSWWTGFVVDTSNNRKIEIGRISAPASWGRMIPYNTFLERYGASNICGNFEPASGSFKSLVATQNNVDYIPNAVEVELRSYTDCNNIMSSSELINGYRIEIGPGTN